MNELIFKKSRELATEMANLSRTLVTKQLLSASLGEDAVTQSKMTALQNELWQVVYSAVTLFHPMANFKGIAVDPSGYKEGITSVLKSVIESDLFRVNFVANGSATAIYDSMNFDALKALLDPSRYPEVKFKNSLDRMVLTRNMLSPRGVIKVAGKAITTGGSVYETPTFLPSIQLPEGIKPKSMATHKMAVQPGFHIIINPPMGYKSSVARFMFKHQLLLGGAALAVSWMESPMFATSRAKLEASMNDTIRQGGYVPNNEQRYDLIAQSGHWAFTEGDSLTFALVSALSFSPFVIFDSLSALTEVSGEVTRSFGVDTIIYTLTRSLNGIMRNRMRSVLFATMSLPDIVPQGWRTIFQTLVGIAEGVCLPLYADDKYMIAVTGGRGVSFYTSGSRALSFVVIGVHPNDPRIYVPLNEFELMSIITLLGARNIPMEVNKRDVVIAGAVNNLTALFTWIKMSLEDPGSVLDPNSHGPGEKLNFMKNAVNAWFMDLFKLKYGLTEPTEDAVKEAPEILMVLVNVFGLNNNK